MRNTFCVRFYCRKGNVRKDGNAPIEISVIVNGDRQMWQLPKKCNPDEFPTKDVKLYCTAIENRINEIYTNLTINNEPISAFIIKEVYLNGNSKKSYTIKQMFDDGLKMKALENGDLNTYKKYERVIGLFYELTGKNENTEANSVTYADIIKFKIGVENKHKPQTVVKEMQHLKYYFNLAFKAGKIKQNPYLNLKIKKGEEDKEYLTQEEVGKIRKLSIVSDRLDKVRDLFLFMCYTGLEWADIINLKKGDVKANEHEQLYIKKQRVKTGIEYTTILYEDAVELWDLYKGELPIISPQKFNKYLKEITDKAKIEKKVTSLTARHTFACYLLNEKKLSTEVVQKMLGHASQKETLHYAKLLDNTVFNENVKAPTTKKEFSQDTDDIEAFNKLLGI